jgi:fructokinase
MSIVVAGEALVDLTPRGELLLPLPGGSPYNVAVGLGRLGTDTRYLGPLSRDPFGTLMARRLSEAGVALDLAPVVDLPTTLAVVHLDEDGRASYGFYLEATAAATFDDALVPELPDAAAVHVSFGAIGLGHVPTGATLAKMLRREAGRRVRSLDPNVRTSALAAAGDYAAELDALVAELDLVKVSDEDLLLLHPDAGDPLDVARTWAASGPALVVVTRGPDGAVAVRADQPDVTIAGRSVSVVDTVGAGDAFTSGLLGWLDRHARLTPKALATLEEDELRAALAQAVEVAAITCTRAGSDPPRADELSTT